MTTRRVLLPAVIIVCLGALAFAQGEPVPLANWAAPPYWNPMIQPRVEGEPVAGMVAHAQGMQAQTEALPSSPLPFVAIAPCRIVDTRVTVDDGFHRPNFADDESRTFNLPVSPDCTGLPATAGAWSLNIQFRPISQLSFLTAYPTGTTMPLVSTMTAGPAAWVQNAAIVPAGTSGAIDIYCQYAGRIVIDINGYYGPKTVVTSVTGGGSTLTGDVTLAEGSNVTITAGAGTLTIAATDGPGGVLPAGTTGQTLYHDGSAWTASSALTNDGTNVGLSGNLLFPATTATAGQIWVGGLPLMHSYGDSNTFLGSGSGNFTMLGGGNTATGFQSLSSNTTGYHNTASGGLSLSANTEGANNAAAGFRSLESNTGGSNNTAHGAFSLQDNTFGSNNTAVGAFSLAASTTARRNTAVGVEALASQSFDNGGTPWDADNTAVGYYALYMNEPTAGNNGYRNTAVGSSALRNNTTGSANTATGFETLYSNTTGGENVAAGFQCLRANTTGGDNIASGYQSLFSNTTGDYNIASGFASLWSNLDGVGNIAIGTSSLDSNTTGNFNIAIGYLAGGSLTTGSDNIDIANQGVAGESDTIRIGSANQTRAFIAGIRGVNVGATGIPVYINSSGQLGTSASSSIRVKQDVADMGEASTRLMELRPVTFRYKAHPDDPLQYGLIAEEVEPVMPELVIKDAAGRPEAIAYHELPAILLNELQKQQAQIADQAKTIQAQQAEIEALKSALAERDSALDRRLAALEQGRR